MQLNSAALEYCQKSSEPRVVLIAGSGPESDTPPEWKENGYEVVRLDIEPRNNPDIIGNMTNLGDIGPFDVIYCCHALEHLYPHEVYQALCEFRRVLKPNGVAVILVPDLEGIQPTDEPLDYPEAGPICGLHLFYGDHRQIPNFPHMAHHSGFVANTLLRALLTAGFRMARTERLPHYNLAGVGQK